MKRNHLARIRQFLLQYDRGIFYLAGVAVGFIAGWLA